MWRLRETLINTSEYSADRNNIHWLSVLGLPEEFLVAVARLARQLEKVTGLNADDLRFLATVTTVIMDSANLQFRGASSRGMCGGLGCSTGGRVGMRVAAFFFVPLRENIGNYAIFYG